MKKMLVLMAAIWAVATVGVVDTTKVTFYVQLVRGTDDSTAPSQESRPIGPKLAGHLRHIFKWAHFWEVEYRELQLEPGKKTKLRLNAQREVEIELVRPDKRVVAAYSEGKLVSRSVEPLNAPMTIIGGDRDAKSSWFIVVRRDKPAVE
jgi:hypothetical protein